MLAKSVDAGFYVYTISVLVFAAIMAFVIGPKYGRKSSLVFLSITGSFGSLTVMACKTLGLAGMETMNGSNQLIGPFTWVLLCVIVISICIQLHFMNKALDIFPTGDVSVTLYVIFTSCVTAASLILYQEWRQLTMLDVLWNALGFVTISIGVMLIQYKEYKKPMS